MENERWNPDRGQNVPDIDLDVHAGELSGPREAHAHADEAGPPLPEALVVDHARRPQIQSQRWLESNGFSLPSVYVVQGSRGRIAAALALDIVVDDRPENCVDVVSDSMARPILVWRDGNRTVPASATRLGIPVVRSVGECLDILSGIDPSAEKRSVLDRIKELLGLKSGPTTPPNPPATRSRSRTPTLN